VSHPDWILLAGAAIIVMSFSFVLAAGRAGRPDSSARITPRMILIRLSLALVFTILGVVGSLLPILQGWIFFLLAFLVLFPESKFADTVLRKAEPKVPRVVGWLRKLGIGRKTVAGEPHSR
jgi:hypothetical protein